jgi:hypothetical protein
MRPKGESNERISFNLPSYREPLRWWVVFVGEFGFGGNSIASVVAGLGNNETCLSGISSCSQFFLLNCRGLRWISSRRLGLV